MNYLHELRDRNPILFRTGFLHLLFFFIFLLAAAVDHRQILGVSAWIKPMKFALSIFIYVLTFGWIMHHLVISKKILKTISWVIALTMIGEMLAIALQAFRGTTSHFNYNTPFDASIFIFMGILILLNTLANGTVLFLFFIKAKGLSQTVLVAIRYGLLLFILGSLVGGVMVSQLAHSVGTADGGPGLFFLNWSTIAGDYRVAHFAGIHAIQVLPLVGIFLNKLAVNYSRLLIHGISLIYAGWVAFTYWQAANGLPLRGLAA